jgi:hypothetical protein
MIVSITWNMLLIILNSPMPTLAFKTLLYGKDYQNTRVLPPKKQVRQADEHSSKAHIQRELAQ